MLSTIFSANATPPLFIADKSEEILSKTEHQSWQEGKNEYRFSKFDSIDLEEYADMMFV